MTHAPSPATAVVMTHAPSPAPRRISSARDWTTLVAGFVVVYAVFEAAARSLGSDRGQWGLPVAAIVVAATLAAERLLPRRQAVPGAVAIGLGRPRGTGLVVAAALAAAIALVIPASGLFFGARPVLASGAAWMLPGLFLQAGLAEEVLFRGYLFGSLRAGRPFRRAALLSLLPFAAVHGALFVTLPWPVATAALILALAVAVPLAHLYELGGATIWAPALLHTVVQAGPKIVVLPGDDAMPFAFAWMAASATLPWLAFAVRRISAPGR
ncbi:MAG: CPBP family intramembrane glutamic endopeptidase [Vicinamibacterales bacterium]